MENQIENLACQICDEDILATEPKTELPCFHHVHTNCFVLGMLNREWIARECQSCHRLVVPNTFIDEFQDEAEAETQAETEEGDQTDISSVSTGDSPNLYAKIQEKYKEDSDFRTDVRKYLEARRAFNKSFSAAKKVRSQQKQQIKNLLKSIREQLSQISKSSRRAVTSSAEYKNYKKYLLQMSRAASTIKKKHNYSIDSIQYALRNKRGFRRFGRHRYRGRLTRVFGYYISQ